jgi:putative DNA methylase
MTAPYRKKLIEVALPLPEINDASAYDKMPGIGAHPKGIHHWWARLPLPTARAILFASVVDDPSEHPDRFPTEESQNAERERLFDIIRSLMGKKLHDQPKVYAEAKAEMLKHSDNRLPVVFDPFAGGGTIPLEANRMGFESHAADLNPVAVLLNKCNLELAPRWTGAAPVNPTDRATIGGTEGWPGTRGLAADIRYYGALIRERVYKSIGHLYPKATLPKELGGGETNVVAWIWVRTVASPNPVLRGKHVPLMNSFWLSTKAGKQVWLECVEDDDAPNGWRFKVRTDTPDKEQTAKNKLGTRLGKGEDYFCILSKGRVTIERKYIQQESKKPGGLRESLVAIVAERKGGKLYLDVTDAQAKAASKADDNPALEAARAGFLSGSLPDRASITGGVCSAYGLSTWGNLFTPRQLSALIAFSDTIRECRATVVADAVAAGLNQPDSSRYADTVVTFLALALDRSADFNNWLCRWSASNQKVMNLFARQALAIVWDYAEANILGNAVGAWTTCSNYVADCVQVLNAGAAVTGQAHQLDAAAGSNGIANLLASTDPPYYDNIGYATLSDFFYVWLRRTIGDLYPEHFGTVYVPKLPELTASPGRFGGDRVKAKEHFESGFRKAFTALQAKMDRRFPLTVYYAFKQSDEEAGGEPEEADSDGSDVIDLTTGWETLLEALISSGFQITGTWPVRASQKWRMVAMGSNALASYIVLACRSRPVDAATATRKEFMTILRRELPPALKNLRQGSIAPVDFAQAAIGPGMAVFSRYTKVIESDGRPMGVRTALGIINQVLDEVLAEQEGEFDPDTRWSLSWFEQQGMQEGLFGEADVLARAKNTAVNGLVEAGVVKARGGKVQLVSRAELPDNWNPATDKRLTVWETTQHLIHTLETKGEGEAADLLNKLGGMGETARDLAYRLYSICERKKWADEALAYNSLVIAWPELTKLALASRNRQTTTQHNLFE